MPSTAGAAQVGAAQGVNASVRCLSPPGTLARPRAPSLGHGPARVGWRYASSAAASGPFPSNRLPQAVCPRRALTSCFCHKKQEFTLVQSARLSTTADCFLNR